MAFTNWFGGSKNFQVGQYAVAAKKVSAGSWKDPAGWDTFGRSDATTFKPEVDWAELKSHQDGSRPVDYQATGMGFMLEMGLGELYAESFKKVFPGVIITESAPGVIEGVSIAPIDGDRVSDRLYWVKATKLRGGVPSLEPLDTIYALMGSKIESLEIKGDLSQQFIAVTMLGFKPSPDYLEAGDVVTRIDPDTTQTKYPFMWTILEDEADEYA